MAEPRTEAGRRWVAGWHTHVDGGEVSPINEYAVGQLTAAILAVEAEAAALVIDKAVTETTELLEIGRDLKARADDVIALENAAYDKGRAEAAASAAGELRAAVEGLPGWRIGVHGPDSMERRPDGDWLDRAAVLALLSPTEETPTTKLRESPGDVGNLEHRG